MKKDSMRILIPVAALVVCIAIGLIAYVMLTKSDNAQPAAAQANENSEFEQTNSGEDFHPDSSETQNVPTTDQESNADIEQEDIMQDTNETSAQESVPVDTITDLTSVGVIRALFQLKNASWFNKVKAFLIGRSNNILDESFGIKIHDAYYYSLKELNKPMLINIDLGHISPSLPMINGRHATVSYKNNNLKIIYDKK